MSVRRIKRDRVKSAEDYEQWADKPLVVAAALEGAGCLGVNCDNERDGDGDE